MLKPTPFPGNKGTMQELLESGTMTIGLLGNKGSGKDTVADFLEQEFGFYKTAFAKKLYEEVAQAFSISVEELSYRGTKETPLPSLALSLCHDGDFWALAHQVLDKEQRECRGVGWALQAGTNKQYLLSPRKALQLWGTEYRRAKDNYYWVKHTQAEIEGKRLVVISDVREDYEAAFCKRRDNGFVIGLNRPNNPYLQDGTSNHSSETMVSKISRDITLENDGTILKLLKKTEELFKV